MFKKVILIVLISLLMPTFLYGADELNGLGDMVITPSGYKSLAVNFPGNVTVITEKDIADSNAKYVYELLSREAGIHVMDYTGAGKTVIVDMRGFGETGSSNVLVMVDGRPVNEVDISAADWASIPIKNVERIEILRGSGTVLYGDQASAGVINILTRRGKGDPVIFGGTEFGSYRYNKFYGGTRGAYDLMSYNVFYGQSKSDGYRLNGTYDGYDAQAAFTIFPEEWLTIDLSGGYHKDWYGLPSGLQRWEIDQMRYRGSTTPNDISKTDSTFIKITPSLHFVGDSMDHDLVLDAWGRKKRLDTTTWDNVFGGGATWDNSQIDSRGGSIRYTNTYYFDSATNKLTVGCDLFWAENRLLTVTPAWLTYNQLKIKKETVGVYINDSLELFDKVIVVGGFRQEWAAYVFDQSENAARYETKSPTQEAFELGLEYKYLEKGGVYGRFSRSFRFPATDEFYSRWSGLNTTIEPQSIDTWEVGVKDKNLDYFQPSVNFFWMKSKDEIFYNPTVGAFGATRNYDRIRRFGIETAVTSHIQEMIDLYFTYTYLEARYDGGQFADKTVPLAPEHKINWGANYRPIEWLEFNFNSEYISEQYSINDDLNRMPVLKAYFVCNGKVSIKWQGIEVFFGINNIFDTRYAAISASNVGGTVTDLHPSPERNYIFGASTRF